MKKKEFTKNLTKVGFCSMACDAEIHEDEIKKLKQITEKDFYFKDYELSTEIDSLEKEFKKKGILLIEDILNQQVDLNYSESQKIILIEISIGIIKADRKIEKEEIDFVNQLIVNLKIPSYIIDLRFGKWDSIDKKEITSSSKNK